MKIEVKKDAFPQYAMLYFASVYSKDSSKILYLFRLIAQIFTKSNYEHSAVCQVIPVGTKTQIITDNACLTQIKEGVYCVFESNKTHGNVVQNLNKRLNGLLNKNKQWTGTVFIQPITQRNAVKPPINLTVALDDSISNLKKPYTIGTAIFCAFNETKIGKWFYKKLKMKSRVSSSNHCSCSNFINFQSATSQKVDREYAITLSPEELCNHLILHYDADAPISLIKIQNGNLLWYDKAMLTVV